MKRFKKLVVVLILLMLFSPSILSAIPQQTEEDVTVNVTTYFSKDNQIHTVLDNYKYGDVLSFENNLSKQNGYEFVFWVVNGVVRYDLKIDNEFIITKDMDLVGIFKATGKYAVLFMDTNGKLLDVQYVNSGQNATDPVLNNIPSKPGFVLSSNKWNKPLSNITKDTVITLEYEKVNDSNYEVNVDGGKIRERNDSIGSFEYNTVITLEANDAPSGKYFSHWQIGNKIVSSKEVYSFTVLEDIDIKAVYSNTQKPDIPLVYLSDDLQLRNNYKSYLGQFYVPDGYTLVEFGMITSNDEGVIHLNSENINRYQGNFYFEKTNEFLKSFSNLSIKSVRAYLITKDPNGNLVTTYNQEISEEAEGFTISADFTTASGRSQAEADGWGGTGNSSGSGYYALDGAGKYIQTPNLNSNGPLKLDMKIWASSANGSQTFTINAYDSNNNVVETSGNIQLKNTSFGKVSQIYTDYTYTFNNINGNIAYIRFIYNKETTGINLRFSHFSVTQEGVNKTIIGIDANLGKNTFFIDEELDLSKTLLTIYFEDGTIQQQPLTEVMVSGFSTAVIGNKTLSITYKGFNDVVEYVVEKRDPEFDVPAPIIIEFSLDLKLSDLELPSGFTWENPNTALSIGEFEYNVTFTPSDTNKYKTVTGIKVTVYVVAEIKDELYIYEIYGGGGNSNAVYKNDYVIIYNNSPFDVDISKYSLHYASNTANSFSNFLNLEGTIKAKGYYVIMLGSNGSVGDPLLVSPHVTGTTNIAASAAKVGLVKSNTLVASFTDSKVVHYVQYSGLSNNTSYRLNSNLNTFSIVDTNLEYLIYNKDVVDIEVLSLRANYAVGSTLDLTNAELKLIYETGVFVKTKIFADMVAGFNSSQTGTFTLTITYQEIITTFTYTVFTYGDVDEVFVYYIDIGATGGKAGEATLIKVGQTEILIDSGAGDSSSNDILLSFLNNKVMDGVIEYVIATHPDSDHIGGMDVIFDAFQIANVIQYSTTASPSQLRLNYEAKVASEGSNVYYIYDLVRTNRFIDLVAGVELEFYDTNYLTHKETNAASIVFTLNAFNTRVLFNGDAENNQEAVYAPKVGDVDIFKMGHHGTANGTSTTLLNYIKPEVAIVTNGDYLGNQYNHPTYQAVSRIYQYSNLVPVYAVTGGNGSGSDRMHQRNGTLTVEINNSGYQISSENYGFNPLELSATDYWLSSNNPYRNLGYYYASATGITEKLQLKKALHDIIDDHVAFSYDDAWNALKDTDEDPNNPNNVILFYTGRSQSKNSHGGSVGQWNREHVWAKSHGGFGETKPAGTDFHHLRPTDVQVNSTRGSLDFDEGGTKVVSTYGPGSSFSYVKKDVSFEPRDEVKGDVARIIFYMAVRYEGDKSGEPDLELNDQVNNGKNPYMGRVSTLLKWHKQDPVDDFERNRNNVIYSYQKNRNPFIDIPHFAILLFEGN